ncbi:MAG: 4Fe-4S binding protein [Chloroflexi bacterium]|nr:4Fe-4S binding protein [Chloroflexota bacterium]
MGNKVMLRIRKNLCLGCGVCAESCPKQAISLASGQAEINQSRCNQCRLCLEVCPQGAIGEFVPVSEAELASTVGSLRQKADDLVRRIERLRQQKNA